jgi:peptidoglycan/LPS O-acetylase OafA/YrhL
VPAFVRSKSNHGAFLSQRHFGSLDGLRCISILAVVWHHGPGQRAEWQLLRSGFLGVHLFFAISGFLITTLLLRERDSCGGISLRRFYARRSLRIFPLYYTVVFLYAVLVFALQRDSVSGSQFFSNLQYFLTYTANWFVPSSAIFSFAWSLASEEQFYCVWPWFEKYFRGMTPVIVMFGLIAAALAIKLGWTAAWIPATSMLYVLGAHIPLPICFGVLLAHLLHAPTGYKLAFRCMGHPSASLASFLLAAVAVGLAMPEWAIAAAFALVVASCVIREDHWLRRVLANRAVVQVGAVSYGMYLMHGLVYNALEKAGPRLGMARHGWGQFVAAVLFTVLVASLSYRYYESFFLRLKKRFESRIAQPDPAPLEVAAASNA